MARRSRSLELTTCIIPAALLRAFRELVQQADWSYKRLEGTRMVDRFAILMPLTQSARTLGLEVLDGPLEGLEIHCWSHTEGSSGAIHKIEWIVPRHITTSQFHITIRHWTARLPRAPWHWSFGERSKLGYLLPTYRRSKRNFTKLGVATGKKNWPEKDLDPWPDVLTSTLEEE